MTTAWMRPLSLGLALAVGATADWAQSVTTGQISGLVVDPNGGAVERAEVVARSPSLPGQRRTRTDAQGRFNLAVLPTGVFALTLTREGYRALRLTDIKVELGKTTTIEASLAPGGLTEMVTVIAETPVIDRKAPDNAVNLDRRTVDSIPSADRDYRELAKFVPSVTSVDFNSELGDTAEEGYPSIRGEGQYGNNYMIDGLAVRDPSVKTPGTPLNYDAIEEVQIIVDGFSPEYGHALGGTVNVITKTGGNEFAGEAAYLVRDDRTSSDFEPVVLSTPVSFERSAPYLNAGGPIVDDELWWFGSYNRLDSTNTFQSTDIPGFGTLPEGVTDVESDLYFGKVTWAPTSRQTASVNYTDREQLSTGLDADSATPEARRGERIEDSRIRVNYQWILSPDSALEFKLGRMERDILSVPVGSSGPAQYQLTSVGVDSNNASRLSSDVRERLDGAVVYTHFWSTGAGRSHELKGGVSYHEPLQRARDDFTGAAEDTIGVGQNPTQPDFGLTDTFNDGARFQLQTVSYPTGESSFVPEVLNEYLAGGTLENRNEEWGVFVQDQWDLGRFHVMFGLRADRQRGFDDTGDVFFDYGLAETVAPRVSTSWDATGDGRNVVKAAWGRFYDTTSLRFGELANSRASFSFRGYSWNGEPAFVADPLDPSGLIPNPNWLGVDFRNCIDQSGVVSTCHPAVPAERFDIHNDANWAFTTEQSNAQNPLDYAGVSRPAELERWLLEYGRQLGNTYGMKVRYVEAHTRGLVEDVHTGLFDFDVVNTDLKRRDYESFEVELRGDPTPNVSFAASWVHSSSKGTNPNQFERAGFESKTGSTNNIGVFLDRPPSQPGFWCDVFGDPTAAGDSVDCVPGSAFLGFPGGVDDPMTPENEVALSDFNNDDVVDQYDFDTYWQALWGGLGGVDGGDGWYGHLPYSIDDLVKFYARFNFPRWGNTYVTTYLQWASGYRTQRAGFQHLYGNYFTFSDDAILFDYVGPCTNFGDCTTVLAPAPVAGQNFFEESGTQRGTIENPSFVRLDLNVGKIWTLPNGLGVELRGEIRNVLDDQTPIAIQNRAVSQFGAARSRQLPRSLRAFVRFLWGRT